jgi:hypothetical protein
MGHKSAERQTAAISQSRRSILATRLLLLRLQNLARFSNQARRGSIRRELATPPRETCIQACLMLLRFTVESGGHSEYRPVLQFMKCHVRLVSGMRKTVRIRYDFVTG